MSYILLMNGAQFIRKARKWGRKNGARFTEETKRGKGGHIILRRDNGQWTTVKTDEIGPGLKAAMLEQLGIPPGAF